MKEKIGKKIKRVRTKIKGFSQDSIGNQGQISQIESGEISNPNKSTLKIIATKLDMPFDELIDGTDWKDRSSYTVSDEIAFSPSLLDIELDDMGIISWTHKAYPLFNERGEKNEYCLTSGEKLIKKCDSCGRQVENIKQEYCLGCGVAFFEKVYLPEVVQRIIDDHQNFTIYTLCLSSIAELGYEHHKWKKREETIQIRYQIQLIEAVQKKLKSNISLMKPELTVPMSFNEIKTELFRTVVGRLQEVIAFDKEEIPFDELVEMAKDLLNTGDSDELLELMQSKVDRGTKGKKQDTKTSDDSNSEIDAVEQADLNNNAKKKTKKESKNDSNK